MRLQITDIIYSIQDGREIKSFYSNKDRIIFWKNDIIILRR